MNPNTLPADVQAALDRGEKIEAIKLYREQTGLGLAEAKAAVEAISADDPGAAPIFESLNSGPVREGILNAVFSSRKVEAVRLYREATNAGLKESLEAINQLEQSLYREYPERFHAQFAGGTPVIALIAAAVLAVVAAAGIMLLLMF